MNQQFFSQLAQSFANAHHEREQQDREDMARQREGTQAFVQSALRDPSFKHEHLPLLMSKLGEAYMSGDKKSLGAFNDVIGQLSSGIPHAETDLPMPQHTFTGQYSPGEPDTFQLGEGQRTNYATTGAPQRTIPIPTSVPSLTSTPTAPIRTGGMESFFRSPQEQTQLAAEHAGAIAGATSEAKLPGQMELADIKNKASLAAIEQRYQNRLAYLPEAEKAKHLRRREELATMVAAQRGRMSPTDEDRVQAGDLAMKELDNKLSTGAANASYAQTRAQYASPLAQSKLATEEARRNYMRESLRIRESVGTKLPPHLISIKNRMEQYKNSSIDLASKADQERALGNPEKADSLQKQAEAELQRAEDQKQTLLEMFPQFVQDNSGGGWPGATIHHGTSGGANVAPVPGISPKHQSISAALAEYQSYVQANPQNRERARAKFKRQNGVDPEGH